MTPTSYCFRVIILLGLVMNAQAGPYAPPAGQEGSTAIAASDARIVAWATGFENVSLGPNTSADPNPYTGELYSPDKTLGPADATGFVHPVLPLGDGGQITLMFGLPITDGPGPDFAVFENGFSDFFLELAFVEVSSDGVNFIRFPSVSLTSGPVDSAGTLDATNLYNLAGKYRYGQGTPFDLNELSGFDPLLDTSAVTHVKIIDVIGDGSTSDSLGNPVYDPFPNTGTAGMDLDAVGVLHQASPLLNFDEEMERLIPDPDQRGTSDDPDGDTILNVVEFALGLHPMDANSQALAAINVASGAPVFDFERDPDAVGIRFEILWRASLSSGDWICIAERPDADVWQPMAAGVEVQETPSGEVSLTDHRAVASGFYRFHIEMDL